ncbi:hypothetical protein Taro_029880 [Colocasia esculenta]|uniref:Uncharacterized protein n=1 Tax=Colocasia esculenta TaxID=4460 RepID=A0A843VSG8_COLES|nr:hypothetical protein [Colocasia esculenta]
MRAEILHTPAVPS